MLHVHFHTLKIVLIVVILYTVHGFHSECLLSIIVHVCVYALCDKCNTY